ncbi:MAG: glycosyltransferase, partial [Flavobacterium sp.]
MKEAKVSIVTPNYNYGHYISETIESILSQDYKNIEHIIVDDGSTDNSVEIVRSYVAKFPHRIKLIVQENKGQSAALNVGFKMAEGQIVGWLNSDDSFCTGAIKQIVEAFEKNPEMDMVFGDLLIINENSEV